MVAAALRQTSRSLEAGARVANFSCHPQAYGFTVGGSWLRTETLNPKRCRILHLSPKPGTPNPKRESHNLKILQFRVACKRRPQAQAQGPGMLVALVLHFLCRFRVQEVRSSHMGGYWNHPPARGTLIQTSPAFFFAGQPRPSGFASATRCLQTRAGGRGCRFMVQVLTKPRLARLALSICLYYPDHVRIPIKYISDWTVNSISPWAMTSLPNSSPWVSQTQCFFLRLRNTLAKAFGRHCVAHERKAHTYNRELTS